MPVISKMKNVLHLMVSNKKNMKDKHFLMDHYAMVDMKRLAKTTCSTVVEIGYMMKLILSEKEKQSESFPSEIFQKVPIYLSLEDFAKSSILDYLNKLEERSTHLLKLINELHMDQRSEQVKQELLKNFDKLFKYSYTLLNNGLQFIPKAKLIREDANNRDSLYDRINFMLSFIESNKLQLEMNMVLCKFYSQGSHNWISVQDSANSSLLQVMLYNLDLAISDVQTHYDSKIMEEYRYHICIIRKLINIKENELLKHGSKHKETNKRIIDLERYKEVWQMMAEILQRFLNDIRQMNHPSTVFVDNLKHDYTICLRYKEADCPTVKIIHDILDGLEGTFHGCKRCISESDSEVS